ncbi:MAG: hypothetical protein AAF196_16970 [Planctomycetota bacterium]
MLQGIKKSDIPEEALHEPRLKEDESYYFNAFRELRKSEVSDGGLGSSVNGISPSEVEAWARMRRVPEGMRDRLWMCVHTLDNTLRGHLRGKQEKGD